MRCSCSPGSARSTTRELDPDGAVVADVRTGRLVTCAALILVLAFLSLVHGSGDRCRVSPPAGAGILVDATVVRCLLVPSLVALFGRWNWWLPAWAARLLRVPPSGPDRHDASPADGERPTAEPAARLTVGAMTSVAANGAAAFTKPSSTRRWRCRSRRSRSAGRPASWSAPRDRLAAGRGYLIALAAAATLMWRRQRPAVVAVAALAIAVCYPLVGYPGWAPICRCLSRCSASVPTVLRNARFTEHWRCALSRICCRWSRRSGGRRGRPRCGRRRSAWFGCRYSVRPPGVGGWPARNMCDRSQVAAAQARERMADERLQVARELHDVLAHTISVIAVRAARGRCARRRHRHDAASARRHPRVDQGGARRTTSNAHGAARGHHEAAAARPTRPQPRLADLPGSGRADACGRSDGHVQR